MSNPILIELREDTSDGTLQDIKNSGEFQVTLDNPLVLRNNDELALSSVFVDSVATNSGKIVIDAEETNFSIKNFLYINNFEYDATLLTPFKRAGQTIVKGLNDGFNYVACENTGTQSHTTSLMTQISLGLTPHDSVSNNQEPCSLHFTYTTVNNKPAKFVVNITKPINFKKEIDRAGSSNGIANEGFYNMDDYKKDFGKYPDGFPFDFINDSFKKADPFIVIGKGFNGFRGDFDFDAQGFTFTGIKLTPFIFTYNFTIPAGAYDPSEFARIMTDKLSNQNIHQLSNTTFTDEANDEEDKYMQFPRSFNSPYLNFSSTLAAINSSNNDIYACRFDGEGVVKSVQNNLLFGSTQVGMEFDIDQQKFYFSQLHSPFYVQKGAISAMGTKFTEVLGATGSPLTPNREFFVANKIGGVGFTELSPVNVWFKKLGFGSDILTSFGVKDFDGAGNQTADYEDVASSSVVLTDLSPITFSLKDGVNTTGNFTSLDSAVNKTTPRIAPDVTTLEDTSQIIKQIYAKNTINQSGSLPYYLIEIDGKGIKSDIRGSVNSAIQNTKISAIVSRYYQTLSYTSAMDGSGAIPYIHKGEPIIIDSFKVRILDPDGTITDNIQNSNVVFLQHTPANQ